MYYPMKTRPIKPQVKKIHNLKQKITNTLEDCFDTEIHQQNLDVHLFV